MSALADYWEQVFKPSYLSAAFRSEWGQYLVLAVAYFIPFRRGQIDPAALPGQAVYPQSYRKIGELLADASYLTGVISEVTAQHYAATQVAEFCRSFVPSPSDRARGVVPATTVASMRGVAIEALADSLETWARRTVPGVAAVPTPVVSEAAGRVTDREAVVTSTGWSISPRAMNGQDGGHTDSLPRFEALAGDDDLAVERLPDLIHLVDQLLAQDISPTLGARARRLAQHLAAILFEIEPTAEATTRLTEPNLQLAMRRSGTSAGDAALDALANAGLLRRRDTRWQFAHPALVCVFAAEHVVDYSVRWVSLHPRHHRLMTWAAAILAGRADDGRNALFCQDLGRALGAWSLVSLLDAAEILAPFRDVPTPATRHFQEWLVGQLRALGGLPSGRLQARMWHCGQQLGVDLGGPLPTLAPETLLPPVALAAARQATDVSGLLADLGQAPGPNWFDDRRTLRGLLDRLRDGPDMMVKRQAAAWLWQSHLQTYLDWVVDSRRPWKTHRATALQVVADLAADPAVDDVTRTLARSALARDAHLVVLMSADRDYRALLFTLQLALGQRLFIGQPAGAWQVASADL